MLIFGIEVNLFNVRSSELELSGQVAAELPQQKVSFGHLGNSK
jgi:hypothetical protein